MLETFYYGSLSTVLILIILSAVKYENSLWCKKKNTKILVWYIYRQSDISGLKKSKEISFPQRLPNNVFLTT